MQVRRRGGTARTSISVGDSSLGPVVGGHRRGGCAWDRRVKERRGEGGEGFEGHIPQMLHWSVVSNIVVR